MKRTISIVAIVLALVISLTACSSLESSIKGSWGTNDIVNMTYTFEGDGSGTISTAGVETPMVYEISEEQIVINGLAWGYTIEDNTLTLKSTVGGDDLVLEKQE